MKTFKLIVLLFSFYSFQVFAQAYKPFPTKNASWNYNLFTHSSCNTCCQDYSYYFEKDTLIQGNTYHKLLKQGLYYFNEPWSTLCTDSISGSFKNTAGYIRNDSLNKKVFLYDILKQQDTLFYDFDLGLGDTLPNTLSYSKGNQNVFICDTVFYANIAGVNRRVLNFKESFISIVFYPRLVLIEGIGFLDGLFYNSVNSIVTTISLQCFIESNLVYPSTASCGLISNLDKNMLEKAKLNVFPNPVAKELTIELSNYIPIKSIQVVDLLGKKLRVTIQNETNSKAKINIDHLPKGVYFIRVETSKGVISKKVVKN